MSKLLLLACLLLPELVFGFSRNPPARRSGVPTDDNGTVCTACHRTFVVPNPDTDGSVTVETADTYTPGVAQTIRVTVKHPQALRWGFQLTARRVTNTNDMAGSLTATNADTITRCDGVNGSCEGARQFIGHANAPVTAAGVGFTFTFDWTPPANDVGDIMFYFAGNAADNSGTNAGDRIYTGTKRIRLSSSAGCSNPRPTLNRILSNATGQPALSPNMLLTITGANLQNAGISRSAAIGNTGDGFFPKEFSCVAVEINGQRTAILSASPSELVVQAPWIVDPAMHQVTVIANPGRSNELRSDIGLQQSSTVAPAFFTVEGKFVRAALANGTAIGDPAVLTGARPARPGEVVVISGTGFGLTDPVWQNGEIVLSEAKVPLAFTVTLGDTILAASDVQYLGLTVGSISGLQQLRIRIPDNTPDGMIPIKVTLEGGSTQTEGAFLVVQRQ
jgi:uncharacterized protein (TIGR03437 family)